MKALVIFTTILALIFFIVRSKIQEPSKIRKPTGLGMLSGAHCVMNETSIKTFTPVPLHGRVDQVFQLKDKRLLLMDTKARKKPRVYPSDVAQLSVYAIILKHQGHIVYPSAYLRFPTGNNKAIYVPVKLYSEKRIINLYHKYIAIKSGHHRVKCTCGKHIN